MSDSTVAYVGLALAVLGIPFTFLVSRYFANRKSVRWYYRERKVLDPVGGEFPSGVQIFFGGAEVPQLSEWSVGFWNSGNQSITASDIAVAVELQFSNCRILQISEISVSRAGVVASADEVGVSVYNLNFNFLDAGDGLAMTVYTEGEPHEGEEFGLSISGTIIGAPKGPKLVSRLLNFDGSQFASRIIVGMLAVALPLIVLYLGWSEARSIQIREHVGLFDAAMRQNTTNLGDESPPLIFGVIIAVLYLPFGGLMILNAFRGYFSTIPENVRRLVRDRPFRRIRSPFRRAIVESMYRVMELTRSP